MNNTNKLFHRFAVAFFPSKCPYCNRVIYDRNCACRKCRRHFPGFSYKNYALGGYPCASPFPYKSVYSKAVHKLKFHNRADLAKQMAMQIVRAIEDIYKDSVFDLVTCVPMHKKDRQNRGYNQAELLARECAAILNLPYIDTLEKFKRNQPQHKTDRREREKNVHGVYRLLEKSSVSGKRVLLIDDVITSGSTLGECARILTKGKCAEIRCASFCTVSENKFIAPE